MRSKPVRRCPACHARLFAAGTALKRARLRWGLTIREAAEALGVPHSTLAGWESGRRALPVSRARKLLRRLKRMGANNADRSNGSDT